MLATSTRINTSAEGKSSRLPLFALIVAAAIVLLLSTLVFALNMRRGLNHDEHQFIAGGALMAQGLLPYRDFAWFHMPGQGWINALLFRYFDHLLLSARLVSIVAAAGTLALLMLVALRRLTHISPWRRVATASLLLLLLIAAPGYWFAAGRAWNHDLAVLLALTAFALLCHALEGTAATTITRFSWLGVVAGILLGAAISVRLTMAPLALPFLLAPLCWGRRGRALWMPALAVAIGMAIGGAAIWFAFVTTPGGFLFGNFQYAALNTQWYALQGADISLWAKLRAIAGELLQPGNLLLLTTTVVAFWQASKAIFHGAAPELRFWGMVLPFVLLGAIAPTPMQTQYLFALYPFAALGTILALRHASVLRWQPWALGAAALVAAVLAAPRYVEGLEILPFPAAWYPVKVHERGVFLAEMMAAEAHPLSDAWAFTLSPILPLEGGVAIDARTATGPFAWRIADLVDADERHALGLLGSAEMDDALAAHPPRALLTALHSDDEGADDLTIEQWALSRGYVAVPMRDEGTLWLSPLAQWETIRLGAQTFPLQTTPAARVSGTLYLTSSAPTATNLNLLLRAVDMDGNELFRFDGWPYGSATSSWPQNALWQDGHTFAIPADATPGNYRIEVSFYDPETLATLGDVTAIGWIVADDELPDSRLADFGDISLWHDSAEAVTAQAGSTGVVELNWRTDAPLSIDYTRFAHLVDVNGALVAQSDMPPQGGFFPTSQWHTGIPVRDRVELPIPADLPAGDYTLHVGLYNAATGERLVDANGQDAAMVTLHVAGEVRP